MNNKIRITVSAMALIGSALVVYGANLITLVGVFLMIWSNNIEQKHLK